ncbi:cyclodeaminase/cyclohydrolase family protein [Rhizobium wenxiniae]|uniref:cyclodeaminase/cyclohydrolase family protein n=1 Tax=Rhizobium wenxiniae TaxID=1737357 RepID=UPI001C6DE9A6|nr:cyclodeaminase/cyclohydrolase family protein [Rhizobium wenxiniae]MBW9089688.1 cyclodeaminase/cyclohydrolase family protein [Rhizobium wenxiniae]
MVLGVIQNDGIETMALRKMPLEELLALTGRAEPLIGGSTASLLAARFGIAMIRMALAVSGKHGADNGLHIEQLDSLTARLDDATEHDRAAAQALIKNFRDNADPSVRRGALTEATREPLSAAHVLVETLETVVAAEPGVRQSVASDLFGGGELIKGAFAAVMMAIENNLRQDEVVDLEVRTQQNRSDLWRRHDVAIAALRSSFLAREQAAR